MQSHAADSWEYTTTKLKNPFGRSNIVAYEGEGTEASPYLIHNEAELRALNDVVENQETTAGQLYRLASDIFMSNQAMLSIGTKDKPFLGTFDGNGHVIQGMQAESGYLFHYLNGTVKNLTLIDYTTSANVASSIACFVGANGKGEAHIKNCCVNGVIEAYAVLDGEYKVQASGICHEVYPGSSVENSYFKGCITVHAQTKGGETVSEYPHAYVGGIANAIMSSSDATAYGTIQNCYSSFSYTADGTFDTSSLVNGIASTNSDKAQNCYFVSNEVLEPEDCEVVTEVALLNCPLGEQWHLSGSALYRPVVKGTKIYEGKYCGGNTIMHFDAIAGDTPTDNTITNLTLEDQNDHTIWNIPNAAVYLPEKNIDTIANGILISGMDFSYIPHPEAESTMGCMRYTLKNLSEGWHTLCTPGAILISDLPEGCQLKVCGTLNDNSINAVEVDSVPAGVPCLIYVPEKYGNIEIIMKGRLVDAPLKSMESSSLMGTFKKKNLFGVALTCDGNKFTYLTDAVALPFTAWIENTSSDVSIIDYLLLDEQSNNLGSLLEHYKGKEIKTKLKRSIHTGGWNTLCLPFDMTGNEVASTFGSDAKLETLSTVTYDLNNDAYTFKFSKVTEIEAGKPYLLHTSTAGNLYDIGAKTLGNTITDVHTEAITGTGTTTVEMKGALSKHVIADTEETNAYFLQGDKLYHVVESNPIYMNAFRCWFSISSTDSQPVNMKLARIEHADGTVTSLQSIEATGSSYGDSNTVHDLFGRKTQAAKNKLLIIGNKKGIIK